MVEMYILDGLFLLGMGVLIFSKMKWNKKDREPYRIRAERIEKERVEKVARMEAKVARIQAAGRN